MHLNHKNPQLFQFIWKLLYIFEDAQRRSQIHTVRKNYKYEEYLTLTYRTHKFNYYTLLETVSYKIESNLLTS